MVARLWAGLLLVVLSLVFMGSTAWAQDPAEDAAAPENEVQGEALEADVDEEGGSDKSDDEGALEEETAESNPLEDKEGTPEVRGPGGRPLRTDYPGTEESLQPRMDTARIEGLDFKEGAEKPEEAYDLRVRELETKIDDLKEKVFRSKSRIVLLKETVLSGNLAGSRAIIQHEMRLGATYALRRALFSLDGSRIFNEIDRNGSLAKQKRLEIYNGSISPGTHNISIMLAFQGSGFGLFSYVEGYDFNMRSSCTFTAEEGKTTIIKIITFEGGGAFTPHEERPTVTCEVSMTELSKDDLVPSEKTAPEGKK